MRTAVVIDVHEHEIAALGQDDVPFSVEIHVESADQETVASAIDRSLAAAGRAEARAVELRLHAPLVQIRTLTGVPRVREHDLEALVRNQHTRFFRPPRGEPVVSAMWKVSDHEPVAIAALAERELIENLAAAVRLRSRRLRRIVPCGESAHLGIPLRTPDMRASERIRALRHIALATVVGASGWILAGATYVFDLYRDDRAIGAELEALKEPLHRIQALEASLTDFSPIAIAYHRQSLDNAWLIPTLSGIAESLPSAAHLHRFVAGRDAPTLLEVHGRDPVAVVEQLRNWWPGVVRLEGMSEVGPADVDALFTIVLEEAP